MPLTVSAVGTGLLGLYNTVKGAGETADAKKRAKYNIRPDFDIQKEYYDNQGLASNIAQEGLPESTKNYYETNSERGLGSSLGAILATGGGVNSVGKLYDSFNRGTQAIAAQDAEQKINNIKNLMATNKDLADQKTQQWVLNKYQPYLDTAKSIAGEKQDGRADTNSGLNTISGAISNWAKGQKDASDVATARKGATGDSLADAASVDGLSTDIPSISPASIPQYTIPQVPGAFPSAAAANITPPDSIDGLDDYQGAARTVAMNHVMNKYQNSPYAPGLYNYLQSA